MEIHLVAEVRPLAVSVEDQIRRRVPVGTRLKTYGRGAEFVVGDLGPRGLVLLLGEGRHRTRLPWACLEGIPDFLRDRGWVRAGGQYSVDGESATLDEHLKASLKTSTSRWLAVVLERAEVVEVDPGPPLRVRLR